MKLRSMFRRTFRIKFWVEVAAGTWVHILRLDGLGLIDDSCLRAKTVLGGVNFIGFFLAILNR